MSELTKTWRGAFPQYERSDPFVYLDTAATSLTPLPVLAAMEEYYRSYRANVHRGLYASAERASLAYETARACVASFVGAVPEEVVFTSGATASSNMALGMLERTLRLSAGDVVLTTIAEHHSMLLPVRDLAERRGVVVRYLPCTVEYALDMSMLDTLLSERTRVVAVQLANNVTGQIHDLLPVIHRAHEVGAMVLVDATAAVGHVPVAVSLGADMLYWSGHKCCGPTGIGALWIRKELMDQCEPHVLGGGMVDEVGDTSVSWREAPARFEAGTPNIAGAIGHAAAATFITACSLNAIHAHVQELTRYAQEALQALPRVRLYSAPPEHNVGVVSFTVHGVHPHDVAQVCADSGVAVRAGHHCAQPFIRTLGELATVRASLYLYNTRTDIDELVRAVHAACNLFR